MNILITGASGFIGRNLLERLKALRDGRDRTRPALTIGEIHAFGRSSGAEALQRYCADCDFVFHLAGVNRPERPEQFEADNVELTRALMAALERQGNRCPVMFASSVQAALTGRFGATEYGRSKRACEALIFDHTARAGAPALVYRLPNVAGKWARPYYNSAVATFCDGVANDRPIVVNDPNVELELLFIDDLAEELLDALEGRPHRCDYPEAEGGMTPRWRPDGRFCACPTTHRATLGEIVAWLRRFHDQPGTLFMPAMPPGSLEKKLFAMYLSYLPADKAIYDLPGRSDARGSFTEVMKTADRGQFSVNVSLPGATKGEHWHHGKWEIFIVVSGRGLIRQRRVGTDEVREYAVSGDRLRAVYMLPGYAHAIVNLSDDEPLVTLMWANEVFDPTRPDTYYEPVGQTGGSGGGAAT